MIQKKGRNLNFLWEAQIHNCHYICIVGLYLDRPYHIIIYWASLKCCIHRHITYRWHSNWIHRVLFTYQHTSYNKVSFVFAIFIFHFLMLLILFYSFVGRSIHGGRMAFARVGVTIPSLSPTSPPTCEDPLHQIPYLISITFEFRFFSDFVAFFLRSF